MDNIFYLKVTGTCTRGSSKYGAFTCPSILRLIYPYGHEKIEIVDIKQLNNSINQSKTTITDLTSQIASLNETINQLRSEHQTIKDSVNRIDQIKQDLTNEITEVKTNLSGINDKIINLGTKISSLLAFVPNLIHKTRDYFMNIVSNIKTGTIENVDNNLLCDVV
jgi:chromosome segregation ATPase